MINSSTESLESLRRRPHWSFSRISGLVNYCTLAWAFRYVYREEPQFTPFSLVFGRVFHSALTFRAVRIMEGGDCRPSEPGELFAELLESGCRQCGPAVRYPDNKDLDDFIGQGRKMLRVYIGSRDPAERITGVSVPFSVPLIDGAGQMLGKPLIGEFDLTVESGGKRLIVDWKTAARKWSESRPRTDLQPACYLYAEYRRTGNTSAGFRFDVTTKTREPRCHEYLTERTVEDFVRLGELVRVLERTVAHECFYPADSSWECGNCPYSLACQGWHRDRARSFHHFEPAA